MRIGLVVLAFLAAVIVFASGGIGALVDRGPVQVLLSELGLTDREDPRVMRVAPPPAAEVSATPTPVDLDAADPAPVATDEALVRAAPQDMNEVRLSFAPVAREAAPAVVNVYASRLVQRQARSPMMNDPFFRRFFGDDGQDFGGRPNMPPERMQSALGSGVIVSADGVVVTNNHVIEGADEVRVALTDRREYEAEIVLRDPRTDLAVLRVEGSDAPLPFLALGDPDALEVGDLVLAIGNPFGIGQTVTSGIISALARSSVGISDFQSFIQTDAAINPGNSGGALVDMAGRLIGINTAIYSRSGGSNGIGFAIPTDLVRAVVEGAVEGGTLRRPYLGAQFQAVTPDLADAMGLQRPEGALVAELRSGMAAERAGLEPGDIVVAVNGAPIVDAGSLDYRLATLRIGETAKVEFLRGTERFTSDVSLEAAPERPAREERLLSGDHPFDGLTVVNLSPAVAEELSIPEASEGDVVVTSVAPDSVGARIGIRRGDVLVAVNGERILDTEDAARFDQVGRDGWVLALERGGRLVQTRIGGQRRRMFRAPF